MGALDDLMTKYADGTVRTPEQPQGGGLDALAAKYDIKQPPAQLPDTPHVPQAPTAAVTEVPKQSMAERLANSPFANRDAEQFNSAGKGAIMAAGSVADSIVNIPQNIKDASKGDLSAIGSLGATFLPELKVAGLVGKPILNMAARAGIGAMTGDAAYRAKEGAKAITGDMTSDPHAGDYSLTDNPVTTGLSDALMTATGGKALDLGVGAVKAAIPLVKPLIPGRAFVNNIIENAPEKGVLTATKNALPRLIPGAGIVEAGAKAITAPLKGAASTIRAERSIQGGVNDLTDTQAALSEKPVLPLTPAQQSGDEYLMSLENKRAADNPDFRAQRKQEDAATEAAAKAKLAEIGGGGNIQDTHDVIGNRVADYGASLDARTAGAQDAVNKRVDEIAKNLKTDEAGASTAIRDEITKADAAASENVKNLYSQTEDVPRETTNVRQAYDEIFSRDANRLSIPPEAKLLLDPEKGEWGNTVSAAQLSSLRSVLLQDARDASASNNRGTQAGIAKKLASAIFDDLKASDSVIKDEAGQKLANANAAAADYYDRFHKGVIGDILGSVNTGGERVATELTGKKIIGSGNLTGDVNYNDLLKATDTPETKAGAEQYLRNKFNESAFKSDGENSVLVSTKANAFRQKNAKILTKFPEFSTEIDNAIKDAVKYEKTSSTMAGRKSAVTSSVTPAKEAITAKTANPEKPSMAAEFLNSKDNEIQRMIDSPNRIQLARQIGRMSSKDPKAAAGLRSSLIEHLSKDGLGSKLLENMNTKEMGDIIPHILDDTQRNTLHRVGVEMSKVEKSAAAGKADALITGKNNWFFRNAAKTAALKAASESGLVHGGGSLKFSAMASSGAGKAADLFTSKFDEGHKTIVAAIEDRQRNLLKALVEDTTTPEGKKKAIKSLNAYRISAGASPEVAKIIMDDISSNTPVEKSQ